MTPRVFPDAVAVKGAVKALDSQDFGQQPPRETVSRLKIPYT